MRKYRGTARFMLGNLNNFDHQQLVYYDDLKPVIFIIIYIYIYIFYIIDYLNLTCV